MAVSDQQLDLVPKLSDGGSRSSPRPETWFRTCSMVATSGVYWQNLPARVLGSGDAL
ncbi:hypothetical protein TIFTF001_015219, partial [Ficus carica]